MTSTELTTKTTGEAILDGLCVNAKTIAKLLNLGKRRVYQLVEEGVLNKRGMSFDLVQSTHQYIDFCRNGTALFNDLDEELKNEQIRLTKARADKAEIDFQLADNSAVLLEDVEKDVGDMVIEIRTRLLNIPARAAMRVLGETCEKKIKAIILDEVKHTLTRLAENATSITEEPCENSKE